MEKPEGELTILAVGRAADVHAPTRGRFVERGDAHGEPFAAEAEVKLAALGTVLVDAEQRAAFELCVEGRRLRIDVDHAARSTAAVEHGLWSVDDFDALEVETIRAADPGRSGVAEGAHGHETVALHLRCIHTPQLDVGVAVAVAGLVVGG